MYVRLVQDMLTFSLLNFYKGFLQLEVLLQEIRTTREYKIVLSKQLYNSFRIPWDGSKRNFKFYVTQIKIVSIQC